MVLPKQGKKVKVDQRLLDLLRKKNATLFFFIYIYIYKEIEYWNSLKIIKKE